MFNQTENELIKISLEGMKYINKRIEGDINSGMYGKPDPKLKEKEFKKLEKQNKIIDCLFEKIKTEFIPSKEEKIVLLVALKNQLNHIDFCSKFNMDESERKKVVKAKNENNELLKKIKKV